MKNAGQAGSCRQTGRNKRQNEYRAESVRYQRQWCFKRFAFKQSIWRQYTFTDISFDIKRGERVALIGNNGTGKTTILKIINDILPADSGEIKLGSKVTIGYYDQEHHVLDPDKTLFDELQDAYRI